MTDLAPPPSVSSPIYEGLMGDTVLVWAGDSPVGKLLDASRAGNYLDAAARYAGLNPYTVKAWAQRGRDWMSDDPEEEARIPAEHRVYVAFARQVDLAEATCEVALVTIIRTAARDDPKLALQMLARRFPNWHEKQALDIGVHQEEPQSVTARLLAANPELARMAEEFTLAAAELDTVPDDDGVVDAEVIDEEP